MEKIAYTNETRNYQHIGGVTIPPGETRDVDAALLPGYQPDGAAPAAAPVDPLVKLLAGAVKNVVPALETLSGADLARALELEQEGQARKSMIEAITVETLRRAAMPDGAAAAAGAPGVANSPAEQDQADPATSGA